MKKLFVLGLTLLMLISSTYAAFLGKVNLTWNPNPSNEFVTKYVVYQVVNGTNYIPQVTATGTNFATVNVTSPGTYTYAVAAFNANGQSGYSSSVTTNVFPSSPASIPTGLNVISVTVTNTP